jgi:hypothetical protein
MNSERNWLTWSHFKLIVIWGASYTESAMMATLDELGQRQTHGIPPILLFGCFIKEYSR